MRGHLTEKADVFAFGVVALEAVAGRSNTDNSLEEDKIYLFEWVSCSNKTHQFSSVKLLVIEAFCS